ncbi:3-dehydroquinate synthase [Candidatus Magnetaquicoccaceae bacterium FCR-1]|uniref:3-dehydroquinate synthase n=1 Tax=Candidatus Magnetaquiglobus chichijimensis TaxID=3141448 RepID=A0ABQ0CD96_9PROT
MADSLSATARTLTVDLGPRSYDILIGAGILSRLGDEARIRFRGRRLAVVTNATVAPLFLDATRRALVEAGYQVIGIVLPDGETHKNWVTLQSIFDGLIANRFERGDGLVALGGGVVGDMTGFAAACHLRGVPFLQVPTTLLAQVDSSVGGKTGINHALGKNLIGAFHQPCLVLMDIDTLATLPKRELLAGLAEVIKYGVLWDRAFFETIETHLEAVLSGDPGLMIEILHRSCAIKAEIVAQDEREQGVRALLNLGHTFGHAVEALTGYDQWLHGEAVAMGMVVAARLAVRIGLCPPDEERRMTALIGRAGLPVRLPVHPVEAYVEAMGHDKKVEAGRIRFVLPERIGRTLVRADVDLDAVRATLAACMA